MSLRGRYVIDRIKRVVSSHLKMPVPPYGEPIFWENVYQKMENAITINPETQQPDFDDTFEWGGITLQDVLEYKYKQVTIEHTSMGDYASTSQVGDTPLSTTFGNTIGTEPSFNHTLTTSEGGDDDSTDTKKEPILMLGCGNSRMGEEMVEHGWRGPLIQVDVAAKALEMIARRSRHNSSRLQFLQEDATHLSSLRNGTVNAVIDKGLIDALFCADEHNQMTDVVKSALRVLKPGGVLCIFSFSRPEFILPRLLPMSARSALAQHPGKPTWQDLQMQELERFLVYRLRKSNDGIREPKRTPRKKQ